MYQIAKLSDQLQEGVLVYSHSRHYVLTSKLFHFSLRSLYVNPDGRVGYYKQSTPTVLVGKVCVHNDR